MALSDSFGRVLAVPAIAPLDMPGVDNSAMDGYALRMTDYQAAHQRGGLPVVQRVPAGAGVLALPEGGCARIFTGAPVPLGADTVVPQERVTLDLQGHIHVDGVLEPGANIRKQSEETKAGSTLLPKGNYLDAPAIALLVSHGIHNVVVNRRLRVALFSTGDELIETGASRAPGQVYDSNRAMLNVLLRQANCEVVVNRVAGQSCCVAGWLATPGTAFCSCDAERAGRGSGALPGNGRIYTSRATRAL
ncbi:MAG: molybdopterin molybdotransferase MoeA [Halomonas sp.]|nr:molybdopterin molybdotransferase MoeA [Halomonas sp.]